MKTQTTTVLGIILLAKVCFAVDLPQNYKPEAGFVPDAKTAIAIAVAVWSPIYGEGKIQKEKPYKVALTNGVWLVEGTLPKGSVGGVAMAEISKADARVLRVSHGQ